MKEITITALTAGQRLDHLLSRYLKEAHSGFLYKMLRKKNITLNGRKATGSEKLQEGDVIRLFFSDETLRKFMGTDAMNPFLQVPDGKTNEASCFGKQAADAAGNPARRQSEKLDIIYEDADVLLVNKPAGLLTQKAKPEDLSLNEYVLNYLLAKGAVTGEDLLSFRPSVCNRLDRNTSGIVAIGKSIAGLQELSRIFKDRSIEKFYKALVTGRVEQESVIDGWLLKDEASNKVTVLSGEEAGVKAGEDASLRTGPEAGAGELCLWKEPKAQRIRTRYIPVQTVCIDGSFFTLLDVELLTGRSHQIRAHLSSIGYPIVGDPKYGDERVNQKVKQFFGIRRQMLHAGRLTFPEMDGRLSHLSGRTFTAPLPADFMKLLRSGGRDEESREDSRRKREASTEGGSHGRPHGRKC